MKFEVNESGQEFERFIIPQGEYDATIHAIIGLGQHYQEFGGKRAQDDKGREKPPVHLIRFVFEIPSLLRDDGKTITVGYRDVPIYFNSRAGLVTRFLKPIFGTDDPNVLAEKFNGEEGPTELLGIPVIVIIDHWTSKDGTKNGHKVVAIAKRPDKLNKLEPVPVVREAFIFNPADSDQKNIDHFVKDLTAKTRDYIMSAENAVNFPKVLKETYIRLQEEQGGK